MSRFVVVPPKLDKIQSPKLKNWVDFELNHFRSRWQALMRGKALEEKPYALDSGDIEESNLILWGDPESNQMIAEIIDRLPIKWGKGLLYLSRKNLVHRRSCSLLHLPKSAKY